MSDVASLALSSLACVCIGGTVALGHHPAFSVPFFLIAAAVAIVAIVRLRRLRRRS